MSFLNPRPRRAQGLPKKLQPGERVLWRGAPRWRSLLLNAAPIKPLGLYFGLLIAWQIGTVVYDGRSLLEGVAASVWTIGLALAVLAFIAVHSWITTRTTTYTITDRRLVLQIGIALPMTVNLPFTGIENAALKRHGDGTGDIPVALKPENRLAYFLLWPHARPWHIGKPQPMLRCVRDVDHVGKVLGQALAAAAGQAGRVVEADEASKAAGASPEPSGLAAAARA